MSDRLSPDAEPALSERHVRTILRRIRGLAGLGTFTGVTWALVGLALPWLVAWPEATQPFFVVFGAATGVDHASCRR